MIPSVATYKISFGQGRAAAIAYFLGTRTSALCLRQEKRAFRIDLRCFPVHALLPLPVALPRSLSPISQTGT